MIDQHLGRRSVSDFQRGVLALRKRDILEARLKAAQAQREAQAMAAPVADAPAAEADETAPDGAPWDTVAASEAGLDAASPATPAAEPTPVDTRLLTSREALAKAARISSSQVKLIEAIQNQAAPEVVAAVKSGDLSLAAAAAVATLPAEEQVQAAQAGVKELKQAAKRVREANRKPRAEPALDDSDADAASAEAAPAESVEALRARIRELEAENATLRAQLAQLQGAA
jgi:polyhydroxyalkanoate synthesis regulator phasin